MFIKRLKLTDFRCFKNLELDFSDHTSNEPKNRSRTLILGENGTGKSNILKAIALVTAGSDALSELIGNPDNWVRYGQKKCLIELDMTTKDHESRYVSLEIRRGDKHSDVIKRADESLREIDAAIDHAERNYFVVGYGASRTMDSSSGNSKRGFRSTYYDYQRSQCVGSILDKSANLQSLEQWALDLDYRKEKDGLDIVRKVFDDFLPGIKFHDIDRQNYQLMLETPDGIIPMDALSDGYQNMASWIGDLLYRVSHIFKDRFEPLNSRGVLLLDEIDLHLHPAWQRKLLSFIQETLPNMQLIATTHSPFTAQQAGKGELFMIERSGKEVLLEPFSQNPQKLLLHQLIMSDVFGLNTDESIHVQKLKDEHQTLTQKQSRNKKEEARLAQLEQDLNEIPQTNYSNSITSPDEHNISLEVLKMYKQKKSGNA